MKTTGLREHEIGVIYLTPCPAKMLAIRYPLRKKHSFVDGTIAISEIYPSILQVLPSITRNGNIPDVRGLGLGWPILGGQVACLKAEECLSIGGLSDAMRVFEDIENEKLKHIQYIEVHSCPTACVGGSLTVENSYIARGRVLQMVQKFGKEPCQEREKIRSLYQKNFFSLPGKIPSFPLQPLDEDVAKALRKLQEKQRVYERLPKIDCGACGSPTCMTFAEDVIMGNADESECLFMAMEKFEELSNNLLETVSKYRMKNPARGEGLRT